MLIEILKGIIVFRGKSKIIMKKKISILVLAIIAATGCAHQDNYRDDNSDVAYSESDSGSDYNMEKDNRLETNSSNDDSNRTIINETTKYTYTAYGDEYCTVSLRDKVLIFHLIQYLVIHSIPVCVIDRFEKVHLIVRLMLFLNIMVFRVNWCFKMVM